MTASADARTIVFILSTNYAGSHFLSLMLGSNPGARHIGEAKAFRKKKRNPGKTYCSLCGSEDRCPLFRSVTPDTIRDIFDIIFTNAPAGTEVLVDISKKPFWAQRFLHDSRYHKKYIHLVRDPRALIRRWILTYDGRHLSQRFKAVRSRPSKCIPLMLRGLWYVYLYKWLIQNREITAFLREHAPAYRIVTYRDLAIETERTLSDITEWIGLDFRRDQLEYWKFEHHGTQKRGYDRVRQDGRSYFDDRWKDFLSPEIKKAITENGSILAYLREQGLVFTEKGLTCA